MQRKEISKGGIDNSLIIQIDNLLGELVETCPVIWGPLVARWAVNQLGRWSLEWEGVIVGRDATLEERVAGWLDCQPAQVLANLTVSCVAHDADNTVAALLVASIHNGPALNWLVAHVGCSFPATIINRILSLGLRNYVASTSSSQANQLTSIDTILSHLAERHFPEIQRELHSFLLTTFTDNPDNCTKGVVPYLLQLANTNWSRSILRALTASLPQVLHSDRSMASITSRLSWWIPQYFPSSEAFIDLLIHLLLDTGKPAACELIYLLLRGSLAPPSQGQSGTNFVLQLFHSLIGELNDIVYTRANVSFSSRVPLLKALGDGGEEDAEADGGVMALSELIHWCLKTENEVAIRRIGQILMFTIMEQGPDTSCSILQDILHSDCPVSKDSIFLLYMIQAAIVKHQSFYSSPSRTLTAAIAQNLQQSVKISDILNTVKKVESLLTGSRENNSFITEALNCALLASIPCLARLVNVPQLSFCVLELISHLPLEKPLSLTHLMCLGHAVVFFFFTSLKSTDMRKKLKSSNLCSKILMQLSHSSLAHSLLVRLLFEAALRPEWSYLFGAKKEAFLEFKESPWHLLLTNHNFDSWVKVPKSHNTIFHAGQIGREYSQMKKSKNVSISASEINLNTQLLLNLLGTCCRAQGANQGATTLALLLVEYISPDIMFNGFPWPEEYIKFTFERDLAIRKTFEEFPVVWHFLELVARCRPALCYCSVLVRALTAALTAFWNTCPENFSAQAPEHMRSTQKLLEIMVVGQFLPEAFAVLPQMVEKLAPHEVVCILQDIWAYLRDHTPSPDRWVLLPSGLHQRPPEPLDARYTDRCRKLIHVHIDIFDHLLPSMVTRQT